MLFIHGDSDRLVPAANSLRLAAALPGCECAVVKNCGHSPQEETPEVFTSLVTDFLRRKVREGAAADERL